MLTLTLLTLSLAAIGLAQEDAEVAATKRVYLTSAADTSLVVQPTTGEAGSGIVVQTITNTVDQQWDLADGESMIQLADTTLCLDAGAEANWKDMALITIEECDPEAPGQQWTVMEDGRIAVTASSPPQQCLDLVFLRAVPGNDVGLFTCAGLANTGAADKGINWPLVEVEAAP